MKTPTTLIIMDGFGIAEAAPNNAVSAACTPVLDRIFAESPYTTLSASGEDVGLPEGQIGNSEVGHTNIGAGRVVYQELPRISSDIASGAFFQNKAFTAAIESAKSTGGALHLMGLLSDGGVHSHNTHLWAFLELCKRLNLDRVYVHCFLDGRDVSPKSGAGFVTECIKKCSEIGVGKIATVMGRFYAMDRDKRWDRIEEAYNAIVLGDGLREDDPVAAVKASYRAGITDEFMKPVVCDTDGLVIEGDSVIFMNFRPDRARQLTRALTDPNFSEFKRRNGYSPVHFVCTAQYDSNISHVNVAYRPEVLVDTVGEVLSNLGLTQLRLAETEKYAHVTFFFNGGSEAAYRGEDRLLVPSPRHVPTYDLVPQMSAFVIAEEAVRRITSGEYDVIILNFANCDMVGHTGVFEAAVKAVETVDECVGKVVEATTNMGGISIITADHGNVEMMSEPDGSPHTAHTTNRVPFAITGVKLHLKSGRLCDIAPTLLDLMGVERPEAMTGSSLILE